METVICLITNNNYFETRYCIENLMSKTSLPFRLHIVDNNSSDVRLTNYLNKITKDISKGFLYKQNKQISLSECNNLLLTTAGENNCVLFPINCIVDNNWLEDLSTSLQMIKNVGCACLRPTNAKIEFSPVLKESLYAGEDVLENVMQTNEKVSTVLAFKPEILKVAGVFDVNLNAHGFELSEFCLRVRVNGYSNYYIRKQTVYKMPIKNEILFPKIVEENIVKFKETVNLMFKYKRFKK